MFDPAVLFERRSHLWEDELDEIGAVSEGRKALAWFPLTHDQLANFSDHDDLVEAATSLRLSVLTAKRAVGPSVLEHDIAFDIFIVPEGEMWRVSAFQRCNSALERYQWGDVAEYLSSCFLGYSEEQSSSWIKQCQHDRLGWRGQTTYFLLESSRLEEFRPVGLRCFPSSLKTERLDVFAHSGPWSLRSNPATLIPEGYFLCRVALANEFFIDLFRNVEVEDDEVMCTQAGVGASTLNEALESSIEIWSGLAWRRRLSDVV